MKDCKTKRQVQHGNKGKDQCESEPRLYHTHNNGQEDLEIPNAVLFLSEENEILCVQPALCVLEFCTCPFNQVCF